MANGLALVILGPLVDPIKCELVRIFQKPGTTRAARRPINHAIEVAESFDFLVEVIWREDGETEIADLPIMGLAKAFNSALIRPDVRVVLVSEYAGNPAMLLLGTREFVGARTIHFDKFELSRREIGSLRLPL